MKIHTEFSIYETKTEDGVDFIRKLTDNPSRSKRVSAEWKQFLRIDGLEVGQRAYLIWRIEETDEGPMVRGTLLSPVREIEE